MSIIMKKNVYNTPVIEVVQVALSHFVLAGSRGNIDLGGGGGNGVIPD